MKCGRVFTFLLLLACLACRPQKRVHERVQVVCTTSVIAEPLSEIFGAHADVRALMRNGVDPHSYKAGIRDLDVLSDADVVVYNGLHLEGKMAEVLESYGREKPVLAMSGGTDRKLFLQAEENPGTYDPHFWFDMQLWKNGLRYVTHNICRKQALADSQAVYRGMARYFQRLDSTDRVLRSLLDAVPQDRRVIVTNHDAFRYFGRAYGWEVRGLQGISTVAEPGLKDMNELVDFVCARRIPAVFVESNLSDKSLKALRAGAAARGHQIGQGGSLYADSPGPEGSYEGTYIGMLYSNVKTLNQSLK